METIVITTKPKGAELYKSKTRQELSLNKTSDEFKKDHSTLISSNSQPIHTKKKKVVKFDMQKLDIVKVESFKRYNAENVFEDRETTKKTDRETYHCKCIIY
jgi:hypothetical protein